MSSSAHNTSRKKSTAIYRPNPEDAFNTRTMKQVFWLSRLTLIAFAVLFLLLSLSLILIRIIVQRRDGLSLTVTRNHYAWTYGPTAILLLVVSLWRQVDYSAKTKQPWQELQRCPQPASQNILLDYVSPLQVTALIKALNNKHYAVASSILVFALLKAIMSLSTVLFVLATVSLNESVDIVLRQKFDGSKFYAKHSPDLVGNSSRNWQQGGLYYGRPTFPQLPVEPVSTYVNLLKNYSASEMPFTNATAFTSFSVPSKGNDGQVDAEVDLFIPLVSCQIVPTHWTQQPGSYPASPVNFQQPGSCRPIMHVQALVPTCEPLDISVYPCNRNNDENSPQPSCPTSENIMLAARTVCSTPSNNTDIGQPSNTYQYLVAAANLEISSNYQTSCNTTHYNHVSVGQAAAVSCSLTYNIEKAHTRSSVLDPATILSIEPDPSSQKSQLANVTDLVFSETLFSTLQAGAAAFNGDLGTGLLDTTLGAFALRNIMASRKGADLPPNTFADAATLQSAVQTALGGLSNQLMRDSFLISSTTQSSGTITHAEQRLKVRPPVLWVMVASFALLSCLALVVAWSVHPATAVEHPVMLASHALIFAKSPQLAKQLRASGAKRLSNIRRDLASCCYSTGRKGEIEVTKQPERKSESPQLVSSPKGRNFPSRSGSSDLARAWRRVSSFSKSMATKVCFWRSPSESATEQPPLVKQWIPYSARRHAMLLTLVSPIVAVITIEILWHYSSSDESFVQVPSDSSGRSYGIRYGSTLAALLIATLYNTLEFSIATMAPFSALSRGAASAERTLFFSTIDKLPPIALYESIRRRHIGASSSSLAAAIGSVLTIITSGLWYMSDSIHVHRAAEGQLANVWQVNWTSPMYANAHADNGATSLFNLIQHGGADNSSLIWEDVVLTSLHNARPSTTTISEFLSQVNSSTLKYAFTMQGLRPRLECDVLPHSALQINRTTEIFASNGGKDVDDTFRVTAKLPRGCFHGRDTATPSVSFTNSVAMLVGGVDGPKPVGTQCSGRFMTCSTWELRPLQLLSMDVHLLELSSACTLTIRGRIATLQPCCAPSVCRRSC
jgi:hypothetical protein